jgi:hypothetical protein
MAKLIPLHRTILPVLFGPIVWAVHFLIVYGGHASLCAAGDRLPLFDAGSLPWLLGGATILALFLLVAPLFRPGVFLDLREEGGATQDPRFLGWLMRLLAVLSLVAVLCMGIAILILPICQQLR